MPVGKANVKRNPIGHMRLPSQSQPKQGEAAKFLQEMFRDKSLQRKVKTDLPLQGYRGFERNSAGHEGKKNNES